MNPRILDLEFQGVPGVIASFLLESRGEYGIIETGPTTTLPTLLEHLGRHDVHHKLRWIAVTHVHLDHAGAVGQVLQKFPEVVCYVHETGARHLIDPSRLLRSATRIYGDQMGPLWGEVLPAREGRVIALADGDALPLGAESLTAVYTPGHATHHVALHDAGTGCLFTGDMAGVRIQGHDAVRPPTPPPDLDIELWKASVSRVLDLAPSRLYLTHYGPVEDNIAGHFADLIASLDRWAKIVQDAMAAGTEKPEMAELLRRDGDAELVASGADAQTLRQYELGTPYGMSVDGLVRYLTNQQAI